MSNNLRAYGQDLHHLLQRVRLRANDGQPVQQVDGDAMGGDHVGAADLQGGGGYVRVA